ncbi:M55 family metallopeptidase [Paenibacillus thermoaerophilus]|uniref:M55 family metallopeptidase n=1 Tax=Paenibacillus thermoaerophilus TaxID=1215385 RepID=A0ABW2V3A1_9BACL|nr:M55 family metallopeptidase [Paenibacillus thermoaerophilus]TMV17685.1 aminopeptidase [Paenibacillus thermoaerophilus]
MKFYVSVDMEGISGIALREQLVRGEPLYEEARRLLTLETNAVTEALLAAGATRVIVKDAHGSGFNFIPELLHPGAEYVMGATRVENRFPGLDETFDGALLIGYHAMGGTSQAVRDHTMTSQGWQSLRLNGRPIGEIGLDALLIGLRGVPVLFVSGDDKTCAEAASELPGVVTYETKAALGRHAALMKAPQRVREELREAVSRAVRSADRPKPLRLAGPYELTIRFLHTEQADARRYDGVRAKRIDGLTASYVSDDLTALLAMAF